MLFRSIQVTSEAVGVYGPQQQMTMVRELRPEAVSLAVREIVPSADHETSAAEFFAWMRAEAVLPQFILYSIEDLHRLDDLVARGIIPPGRHFALYVLGRYARGQVSEPGDLIPFLSANASAHPWAVCAFGAREAACAAAATAFGGHVRVGFENNLFLADGSRAPDNAALFAAAAAQMLAQQKLDHHGLGKLRRLAEPAPGAVEALLQIVYRRCEYAGVEYADLRVCLRRLPNMLDDLLRALLHLVLLVLPCIRDRKSVV